MTAARAKLAMLLGAMQGQAAREHHEGIPSGMVMMSVQIGDNEPLTMTWGELALCAGADKYAGPDLDEHTDEVVQ